MTDYKPTSPIDWAESGSNVDAPASSVRDNGYIEEDVLPSDEYNYLNREYGRHITSLESVSGAYESTESFYTNGQSDTHGLIVPENQGTFSPTLTEKTSPGASSNSTPDISVNARYVAVCKGNYVTVYDHRTMTAQYQADFSGVGVVDSVSMSEEDIAVTVENGSDWEIAIVRIPNTAQLPSNTTVVGPYQSETRLDGNQDYFVTWTSGTSSFFVYDSNGNLVGQDSMPANSSNEPSKGVITSRFGYFPADDDSYYKLDLPTATFDSTAVITSPNAVNTSIASDGKAFYAAYDAGSGSAFHRFTSNGIDLGEVVSFSSSPLDLSAMGRYLSWTTSTRTFLRDIDRGLDAAVDLTSSVYEGSPSRVRLTPEHVYVVTQSSSGNDDIYQFDLNHGPTRVYYSSDATGTGQLISTVPKV